MKIDSFFKLELSSEETFVLSNAIVTYLREAEYPSSSDSILLNILSHTMPESVERVNPIELNSPYKLKDFGSKKEKEYFVENGYQKKPFSP